MVEDVIIKDTHVIGVKWSRDLLSSLRCLRVPSIS